MDELEGNYSERMLEAIRTSEVMSVFFIRVGQSLIADLRRGEETGPAVMIDDIVSTPQDRLQSFRRLRPGLPLPERLTLAPWTSAVRDFQESGLLDALLARCRLEGGEGLAGDAATAFKRLAFLEQKYLRDLVKGVGMQTLWQRSDP